MSKIIGVTVGTPAPRPNWTEENERSAAYIKNKPIIDPTLATEGAIAEAKATGDAINQVQKSIDEVSYAVENLDSKYYTESEIDSMISNVMASVDGKSDLSHNHDDVYSTKDEVQEAIDEAKSYADSALEAVKSDLLNGAGAAYDTLKELGDLIDENHDAIEVLEDIATGKADADHTHSYGDILDVPSTVDIYVQEEEPADALDGVLWVDLDADGDDGTGSSVQVLVDPTLTQSGFAADAKAVGDALATKQPIGDYATVDQVNTKVSYTESQTLTPEQQAQARENIGTVSEDEFEALSTLVGDESVATQISTAIAGIDSPIDSVNGKTGTVVLTAADVGALPSDTKLLTLEDILNMELITTDDINEICGQTIYSSSEVEF